MLEGKVALVTGAARGIGAAIAQTLAGAGAIVVAADLLALRDTEQTTRTDSNRVSTVWLDVADDRSVKAVVSDTVEREGGIDILVNAAGAFHAAPFLEVSRKNWHDVFDVNVFGVAAMMQTVVPSMLARGGGRIVNIASIGGRRADEKTMAYSASKAAVISITQAAALELARQNIRVNAIAPGPVLTDMWNALDRDFSNRYLGQPEGSFTAMAKAATPIGHLAKPADIANVALFLCSPACEHMTGQTLNVDGGAILS